MVPRMPEGAEKIGQTGEASVEAVGADPGGDLRHSSRKDRGAWNSGDERRAVASASSSASTV